MFCFSEDLIPIGASTGNQIWFHQHGVGKVLVIWIIRLVWSSLRLPNKCCTHREPKTGVKNFLNDRVDIEEIVPCIIHLTILDFACDEVVPAQYCPHRPSPNTEMSLHNISLAGAEKLNTLQSKLNIFFIFSKRTKDKKIKYYIPGVLLQQGASGPG